MQQGYVTACASVLELSLIVQVAQLRALAKTNPSAATIPAMSANSASQKAAALAAAALLQKKFGSTSGPGNADAIHTRQSPDRYDQDHNSIDFASCFCTSIEVLYIMQTGGRFSLPNGVSMLCINRQHSSMNISCYLYCCVRPPRFFSTDSVMQERE